MKDTINYEIPDLYLEHSQHQTYEPQCSECYKFALSIPVGERAFLLVDMKTIDDTLRPPLTREDEEQLKLEETHPCRWCGTLTNNLECNACDKKSDEAYFERHG